MSKEIKVQNDELRLNQDYKHFLTDIKTRLQTAQIRAALAANSELIKFYWELGTDLIEKQKSHQWGSHFLEQFSHDMRQAFPEMQGFSKRNLEYMRRFAQLYPYIEFTKQPVSQLPWGHIVRLMQMVKEEPKREWYAEQTIKNGWSRTVLEMQIESGLYERQAIASNKTSNYHKHLPELQSGLANEILKDPYNFDFLTIQGKAHERDIENALITHIRDFLIELGQGFAFVGSQVPLTFDDQEFFVDLLFYHLELRAFVVIELKNTKFKPEHTGQLGFYLAAVDDQLRKPGDNQTIGILLCKSKNKVIAEYALRNISAPIGVSEYTLSKSIPTDLKGSLPTVEEIEAELNESAKED
ncbi:Putative cytoplasmic protein [Legionella beliardensis]|uniref:Cytoplasmic protein n=1 Tax=Legionella beliardensis TaxID=91822 RepID=A0A378I4U9_9GAMM|nr:PDDEXK nuclease domain-containing protein [Legionella beliardensis]STX27534.1 Putative cytoplasmic protein [Legionella beliardensis]